MTLGRRMHLPGRAFQIGLQAKIVLSTQRVTMRMAPSPTIRALLPGDLAAVKELIAANELFPPEMLDEMTESFFNSSGGDARWLTAVDSVASEPIAVAYYAPEKMTDGTWNLLLIAVHPRCQSQVRPG